MWVRRGRFGADRDGVRVLLALACVALLGALVGAAPVRAIEAEFAARPVKRDILALYDARHELKPHQTRIHHFAEMPLNHLGLRVVYRDINAALPGADEIKRYAGVITWLIEPLAEPERYIDWLDDAMERGLRLVFMSELAPPEPPASGRRMARILGRLGLEATQQFVNVPTGARVVDNDPTMIGFERPLDKVLPDFPVYLADGARTKVHLSIETATRIGKRTAALVVTNEAGGFAADEFTTYFEPNTDKVQWILNPFNFFARAFGAGGVPVPDTTTVSGRRIYFSHIDGDGWNNLSEIEAYRDSPTPSAEVVEKEAIVPYPDLPVTVGLIAGDIDPVLGGQPENAVIARRLFALPQVEVGSHTYTHPFNWQFFERYSRTAEQQMIDKSQRPGMRLVDKVRSYTMELAGKTPSADPRNRYIAGSDELPRTYLKHPFDITKEVAGALAVSEGLAPKDKKAKLYMWSGDTTPYEGAIAATRTAGARNINGGDSRLDAEYPSVFYVPPISRPMGNERQIFAVNSNENTYTNDWLGPYYGFFMLERTLDNTETPRRLKPFNLYYHMYSGEKASALAALKHMLELARRSRLAPIAASHYAAIADDFFSVEMRQIDADAWEYTKRGLMQTVRLDDAEARTVDMDRSRGVIGYNRHAGSLYVTLDPAEEAAVVALGRRNEDRERVTRAARMRLVDSRWQFRSLKRNDCGIEVVAEGFGAGEMEWHAPADRGYELIISRGSVELGRQLVRADHQGVLKATVDIGAIEPVSLQFECHE